MPNKDLEVIWCAINAHRLFSLSGCVQNFRNVSDIDWRGALIGHHNVIYLID